MRVVNLGSAEKSSELLNRITDRAGRFPIERRVFLGVRRMDMQAIVLAIHLGIDAADELIAVQDGQHIIAVLALVLWRVNLDPEVEVEQLRRAGAIADEVIEW